MMVGERLAEMPEIKENERSVHFYRDQLKAVVSAACLAHDLGNPAFGHSGEEAISKYFLDRANDQGFRAAFSAGEWEDLTHFEGNANALRILTKQFNGRLKGGYQITYTTLASILKYPCESLARDKSKGKHRSKYGYFQSDEEVFDKVVKEFKMIPDGESPRSYFRHPFVYLVEAADDICYSIIDYEDAHRLGILSFAEVRDDLIELIEADGHSDMSRLRQNLETLREDKNESVAYLRAKAITALVRRCADSFIENREAILAGKFSSSLMGALEDLKHPLSIIEKKSIGRIYNHESVVKIELAGFKIMSGLIEDLVEAVLVSEEQSQKKHQKILSLIPSQYKYPSGASPYEKVMTVLDYVSGMTDNYALELYRNLRGISVPAV